LTFLLILAAGAAAVTISVRTRQPYRGYAGTEQFVDIAPGSSTKAIGDRLVAAGVVRDPLTYRLSVPSGRVAG
jgi:cell division protein YceG involved in septum cleavage